MGLGLSPVMPGTCGAFLGVLLHLLIYFGLPPDVHFMALTFGFLATSGLGVALTPWAERYWNCPDPPHYVLDEVSGYLLVPLLFRDGSFWPTLIGGFFLFRVLDIFKLLPPARLIDTTLHGPWGVLLDDLVSAGYAALILQFLFWFGPHHLLR